MSLENAYGLQRVVVERRKQMYVAAAGSDADRSRVTESESDAMPSTATIWQMSRNAATAVSMSSGPKAQQVRITRRPMWLFVPQQKQQGALGQVVVCRVGKIRRGGAEGVRHVFAEQLD